jgi:ribosomal protein S19
MKSKWKVRVFAGLNSGLALWSRPSFVSSSDVGKRVKVYNGKKFVSILVRKGMVASRFGEFVVTKSLGSGIHMPKRKK